MDVIVESDKQKLQVIAASKLQSLFELNRDRNILFLSSGGSSFELLNTLDFSAFPKKVSISVLDERFSANSSINNFAQLTSTNFYKKNFVYFDKILDTRVDELEELSIFALRIDQMLKNWRKIYPEGVIIATVSMGPDGHISGIMPFPENPELFESLFNQPGSWVTGYDADGKNPYPLRATTTIPFLKEVNYSLSYIIGENKKNAFTRLMNEKGSLYETPARLLREMKNVSLFTDISI